MECALLTKSAVWWPIISALKNHSRFYGCESRSKRKFARISKFNANYLCSSICVDRLRACLKLRPDLLNAAWKSMWLFRPSSELGTDRYGIRSSSPVGAATAALGNTDEFDPQLAGAHKEQSESSQHIGSDPLFQFHTIFPTRVAGNLV